MENYRVQIDKDNWFSVDSKIIEFQNETVRVVNLRSINGFIGENFNLSDPKLKEIIRDYLRMINNVELLNIYSRAFNKFNWFEIYSNYKSSEKAAENELSRILDSSNLNNNSENLLVESINKSNLLDESKIKVDMKDQKGMIIPSKLYENMNEKLPKFQKLELDQMGFIPIWYINGSPQTNAKYCELFTTFEILIHILSKRFITFESQLLSISSTEIQYATARRYDVEDYLRLEKKSLTDIILQKDKKIDQLQNTIDEMKQIMIKINAKNDKLLSEVSDLKVDNQNLNNKNDKLLSEVSDLKHDNQNLMNQNNDLKQDVKGLKHDNQEIKQSLTIVTENITQMSGNMLINQTRSQKTIKKKLPENYISTKSTDEVFILINRPSLTAEIDNDYKGLTINDVVLDSISCQLRDRNQHLLKHDYNEDEDEIIFESRHGNSLDFNKFVQEHRNLIRPLNDIVKTNNKYIRKFVVKIFDLEQLKEELKKLIIISNGPRAELLEINDKSIEQVINPLKNISNAISSIYTPDEETKMNLDLMIQKFNEKFNEINNKLDKNKEEINQNIENLNQKVEENIQETKIVKRNTELILDQQITKQIFKQIFGENEEIEIFKNHKYRTINAGVEFMKYPTQESKGRAIKESYLTVNDLLNSRLRSSDGSSIDINQDKINQIKKLLDS